MEEIQTALVLMGVGMVTVFGILTLVVLSGQGLILFVNRYVFKEVVEQIGASKGKEELSARKIAAISAAIQQASGGQANIERITKLKS